MAKVAFVGPKNRKGFRLMVDGVQCHFKAGDRIPDSVTLQGKYFKDKRAIWVEETPVKKESPKPTPKTKEKADKSATPSPSSEGAGASAPAPLEVSGATENKSAEKKTKRKRKKLFRSE